MGAVSKLSLDWHELRRKPVAILGAGVSGKGVEKLLRSLDWEYATFDQQSRAFGWTEAKACSVAVVSPGFAPDHSWIEIAKKAGMKVLGEADFASAFWPGKIVAVTGTNGKTTLVRFLAKLFNETNRSAVATGNVGYSFSDLVAEKRDSSITAMLELSSFQTENLRLLRPDAVIWTNVDEDHLDRHGDMPSYIRAKGQLVDRLESGPFLAGVSVLESVREMGVTLSCQPKTISREDANRVSVPDSSPFATFPQRENLALALAFADSQGISDESVIKVLDEFVGEPHRLEKVATVGKATFWNDSKATNFSAALAACRHFAGKAFWIGGGQSKGADEEAFAHRLHKLVARAYLIGETGPSLGKRLSAFGLPSNVFGELAQAVKAAFEDVREATDILFSPGFASFDNYSDYSERGKSFVRYVFQLNDQARKRTQVAQA